MERQRELDRPTVFQICERKPDEGEALRLDQWRCRSKQLSRRVEDRLGLSRGLRQRVRAGGAREVGETQSKHDGPARATGAPEPPSESVNESNGDGVDLLG